MDADEVIFIHHGEGKLKTQLGNIPFFKGDYLVIPRGMIYQMEFKDENNNAKEAKFEVNRQQAKIVKYWDSNSAFFNEASIMAVS